MMGIVRSATRKVNQLGQQITRTNHQVQDPDCLYGEILYKLPDGIQLQGLIYFGGEKYGILHTPKYHTNPDRKTKELQKLEKQCQSLEITCSVIAYFDDTKENMIGLMRDLNAP